MSDIHIHNCDSGEQPSGQTWGVLTEEGFPFDE